jgi:predicted  nucleic acid-binding Zn-ribbon protein
VKKMATNEVLGHMPCPICGFDHQEVRKSAAGKPYLTCDECGCQIFTRQPKSQRAMLAKLKRPEQPAVKMVAPETKKPEAKPAPSAPVQVVKPAASAQPVAPQAKTAKPEEEKTLFDVLFGKSKATEGGAI